MNVSRITLRWAGLKVQNGSKNLVIVQKCERWCRQENLNEENRQMKNNNNKNLRRFSQASTIAGSSWLLILKNDYRITFFFKRWNYLVSEKSCYFWLLVTIIIKLNVIYIIYVIHNFNYLWLLMIIDDYL